MKVIFLIAAHKNTRQINRLAGALVHPDASVYIHLDKKSTVDPGQIVPTAKLIRNRIVVEWSRYSQVEATLVSLRQIMNQESGFDYLYLISGQDYPIIPVGDMISFLEANRGNEFIGHVILDQGGWSKARLRFERFHFTPTRNPVLRQARKMLLLILGKTGWKRKFHNNLTPYGGSSWWTLSRECLTYILQYMESSPGLESFLKTTLFADEMIFHTIIMDSPFRSKAVNNDLRHIEWIKGNPNPNILKLTDIEKILASGKHFARKFDPEVDGDILDALDRQLNHQKAKNDGRTTDGSVTN